MAALLTPGSLVLSCAEGAGMCLSVCMRKRERAFVKERAPGNRGPECTC